MCFILLAFYTNREPSGVNKAKIQGKLQLTHLCFVRLVTTTINKTVIEETTLWTLSDWMVAMAVLICCSLYCLYLDGQSLLDLY